MAARLFHSFRRRSAVACNLCGSEEFLDQKQRKNIRCATCGSVERTRVLKLVLDELGVPQSGQRLLHLAPEKHLAKIFRDVLGAGYDPVDLSPSRYPWEEVRRFDLTTDLGQLETASYDVIVHSHVMEHVPCNVTAVLYHLHRALAPDGVQVFCIPVLPGTYAEDLGELTADHARKEFGQHDHVRRFGSEDLQRTLGMIFDWPETYDLELRFPAEVLDQCNIPDYARRGWHPHSVLAMHKDDLKLTG